MILVTVLLVSAVSKAHSSYELEKEAAHTKPHPEE